MDSYVIGVDIGTGSTKALAVNARGETITSCVVPYPSVQAAHDQSTQDPEVVCNAFFSSVSRITQLLKASPDAIIFSTAMHSLITVDRSGTALSDMIIWSDNRSAAIAERVRQSSMGELLYEQNGTPLHAMSPLFKIMWLRENDPTLFEKSARFISVKEYIWLRLFGVYELDYSLASATGMMNIETCKWDANALALAGINESRLSRIVPTDFKRSNADMKACAKLGINAKTLLIIGASDGCFANLGSFAIHPGVAALTIGTSSAIRVASNVPVHNFKAMTFNYRLDDHTFICGGPGNNGGSALKWYVENFLSKPLQTATDYDEVLKSLFDCPPGADGLIFLPYLFGERAPHWDSHASASFFGIRSFHKQCHFTRAVVEGISMALYDICEHLMNSGISIERVHVSGGFVRSTPWLKILANMFNRKLCLLNTDDASALGAAYFGLKNLGFIQDYSDINIIMKEVYPDASIHEIYRKNFEQYRHIYKQLKAVPINP